MKQVFRSRSSSLMVKIIVSNVAYVMLPIFIAVSFLSVYLISKITTENENFRNYVSEKTVTSVSSTVIDINNITISILSDSHIINYLTSETTSGNLALYNLAKESLMSYYLQNQYISDIYIRTNNGKSLHCDANKTASFSEEEIKNMDSSIGGWFWSKNSSDQPAMYRVIRDSNNRYQQIAYLKLIINPDAFLKTFNRNRLSGILGFALFDTEGRLVIDNLSVNQDWVVTFAQENPAHLLDGSCIPVSNNGKDYYFLPSYSTTLKGSLVTFAENPAKSYRNTTLLIIIGTIILVFCISALQIAYYRREVMRPIFRLGELMKSVENENFKVQFQANASSEIQTLAEQFNSMAKKLHLLYDEVYTNKILLQEAEFKRLQSEINPHFLYNALDSARWMVELGQRENASHMLEMLSQLFRLSLKKSDGALIPLKEELVHANTYMGIQQLRFSNKLLYSVDLEEGLGDVYVMKFILQPLLENAILHGISCSEKKGEISLNIYRQDELENVLVYYLYDSGLEADEEKINHILNMEPDERQDNVGLALQNINGRLKIKFGLQFGITFQKLPRVGSVFIVKQPFITKEDLSRYA